MCFVYQRIEFGLRQLRRIHGVGKREYATRRTGLDDRRAVLVCQANRPARFIGSVDHANFRPGLWAQRPFAVSGFVAMSTRRSDGVYRHQHARPRNDAALAPTATILPSLTTTNPGVTTALLFPSNIRAAFSTYDFDGFFC